MIKLFIEVWCSRSKIIIIAGYHLPEYWLMLFIAKLKGKKVAVFCDSTVFDNPQLPIKSILKKFFFSNCDVLFGYGNRSRDYLILHGVSADKIVFRCQAAALPHDYDRASILKKRLNKIKKDTCRFLYVGRLSKEKNIDDLLRAFSLFISIKPSSELIIIGNGPLDTYLRMLALELGLNNVVKFTGSKNSADLIDEYLAADIFVLPSSSEPWGLVVNEALSYGCPVIVSDRCGCVPELVIEGQTGFIFECGNIDHLCKQMINATHSLVHEDSIIENCLNLICEFTPDKAAQQILSGCLRVIDN